jgi:predicted negative regulator of RcsB-dependent stress response
VDRLTRKGLKQDKFAQEVGHTFEFLTEHKKQLVLYGSGAVLVVLVAVGWWFYGNRQRATRQEELTKALEVMAAGVAQNSPSSVINFATTEDKDKAIAKSLTDLATKYSGTTEGSVGRYLLGSMATDDGKLDEGAKAFSEVAKVGDPEYASLANYALAQVRFAQGRPDEAEKLLRALIAKPTLMVSKAQATIALAQGLAASKPQEARNLLEPLKSQPGSVGRAATSALEGLTAAK